MFKGIVEEIGLRVVATVGVALVLILGGVAIVQSQQIAALQKDIASVRETLLETRQVMANDIRYLFTYMESHSKDTSMHK